MELKKILCVFKDPGADSLNEIGVSHVLKHNIDLQGDARPVAHGPQRLSPDQEKEVRKQVEELLKLGKIRSSKSPWGERLVLVKKSDGSTRICVDYRDVNAGSRTQAYPMRRVGDLIERMGGKGFFLKIYLKAGYWQVLHAEKAREITAFVKDELIRTRKDADLHWVFLIRTGDRIRLLFFEVSMRRSIPA